MDVRSFRGNDVSKALVILQRMVEFDKREGIFVSSHHVQRGPLEATRVISCKQKMCKKGISSARFLKFP